MAKLNFKKSGKGIVVLISILVVVLLATGLILGGVFKFGSNTKDVNFASGYSVSYFGVDMSLNCALIINPKKELFVISKDNVGRKSDIKSETPYKVLDNVKSVNENLVLTEDGKLIELRGNEEPRIINRDVKSFELIVRPPCFYQKTDNSLWLARIENFRYKSTKILDDVKTYSDWKALKNDGTFYQLSYKKPIELLKNVESYFNKSTYNRGSYNSNVTFAIKKDHSLWALGSNVLGELGVGHTKKVSKCTKVMDGVASVISDGYTSFAVALDHSLWGWGANNDGQLGDGTKVNKTLPLKMMDGVKSVQMNFDVVYITKDDDSVWSIGSTVQWGEHCYPYKLLDDVKTLYINYKSFNRSSEKVYLQKKDDSLWELHFKPGSDSNSKTEIPQKVLYNVKSFDFCSFRNSAITTDGNLWVWGAGMGLAEKPERLTDRAVNIVFNDYTKMFFTKDDESLWAVGRFDPEKTQQEQDKSLTPWKVELNS